MAGCATPVIHVLFYRCITCVEIRCITCVADLCIIHMFYTCVGYTHVLLMYFDTCNTGVGYTDYCTCNTCVGYTTELHV